MNILKEELVDFQIVHMDPIGDIYEYRNGIIRIIQNSYKNYVKQLLKSGLIDRLVEEHLWWKRILAMICLRIESF